MECSAGDERAWCAALGGWVAIGAMLSISCASGPSTFVAQVENKTGEAREVRVVSQIDERRVEVSADVPPGGVVAQRTEGHARAEVGGDTRFDLTWGNPSVEVWENPAGELKRRRSLYYGAPGGRP
jgi:hypothetical protein